MIDPADIQTRYGTMSDEELIHFANEQGNWLTKEAFLILRSEFIRRDLDADLIRRLEDGSHKEEQAQLERITKTVLEQGDASALSIALNEKRDGKNDEAIVWHLMEAGLDEEKARLVTSQIQSEAIRLQAKARNTMLTSMFAVCAGFALYLISPDKPVVTFLDILSTCTIFFASLSFIVGFIEFKKFKSILSHIEKEQSDGPKQSDSDELK